MAAEECRFALPPEERSPALARANAVHQLREWGLEALDDVGALLVTELVTNAVRHAGTEVEVVLCREPDRVVVSVVDRRPCRLPPPTLPPRDAFSGRGLFLVDALSRRWGWEDRSDGKAVWFELAVA